MTKTKPRIVKPENHWATPWDLTQFNGLEIEWAQSTFVNPLYDLKGKTAFVLKAYEEVQKSKSIVMLLPVSTSTELFHKYILPYADIDFLNFRPKYEGINSQCQYL